MSCHNLNFLKRKMQLRCALYILTFLGIIHEFILIAEIINRWCPAYVMKNPKKQVTLDRSFLFDTARHISSYLQFWKKTGEERAPSFHI